MSLIGILAVAVVLVLAGKSRSTIAERVDSPQVVQPVDLNNSATLAAYPPVSTLITASSPTQMPAPILEVLPTSTPLPPTAFLTEMPTATATLSLPTFTPSSIAARPMMYTLHPGEFPYCIARRFNVDPAELLALSELTNQQAFYSGMVLTIPQTGRPFPGNRVLQPHPTTYIVARANETLYGMACLFGDLDPAVIALANNIPVDSTLFAGQQLNIP